MVEIRDVIVCARPPLVEVICGVQFKSLGLGTVELANLARKFEAEYPHVEDAIPLPPAIELPPGVSAVPQLRVAMGMPQLRRVMLLDSVRGSALQLQDDRMVHNWHRRPSASDYPRFKNVLATFMNRWKQVKESVSATKSPDVVQYEVTYVNSVPSDFAWSSGDSLSAVFPWLDVSSHHKGVFPLEFEFGSHEVLPTLRGRLHVGIRTMPPPARNVKPDVRFELTVRGTPNAAGIDHDIEDWMVGARTEIVESFRRLTGERAHTEWGMSECPS